MAETIKKKMVSAQLLNPEQAIRLNTVLHFYFKPLSYGWIALKASLLTGRTIDQGRDKELSKFSEEYMKSVAVCYLDPEDMKKLGIRENANVRVTTNFGSVVVKAKKSLRGPHSGVVFIPYGAWANTVADPKTHGTGMPSFKGIQADIEPAPREDILNLEDLIKKHYKKV